MDLDYVNNEYKTLKEKWDIIDDICDVENVERYIEYLNPNNVGTLNAARNRSYRHRAVFYELASYTRRGLLGMLFRKWPILHVPEQLDYLKKNCDGKGNSIFQQSQQVAKSVIGKGKAGLLVDYPRVEGEASAEDINTNKYFATIHKFEPEQILLPCDTVSDGAYVKISRVRLKATVRENFEDIDVIRVLELIDGVYVSSEYRNNDVGWSLYAQTIPLDGTGKPLTEIPFVFVGAENNTQELNQPPMYGICKINIGHYNNSAAYENSVFEVGQVQPWAKGLTLDDGKRMEAEGIFVGSGRLICGVEEFGFAQAEPNMIAREAMDKKITDIVGLGGMFVQPGSAVKTATQSAGEQLVQHSILSLIASNLSEAYTLALKWVCAFMNVEFNDEVEYTILQDFVEHNADAQMFSALLSGVMQGKLTQGAFINWLQKMSIEDSEKTVEEIKQELSLENASTGTLDLNEEE